MKWHETHICSDRRKEFWCQFLWAWEVMRIKGRSKYSKTRVLLEMDQTLKNFKNPCIEKRIKLEYHKDSKLLALEKYLSHNSPTLDSLWCPFGWFSWDDEEAVETEFWKIYDYHFIQACYILCQFLFCFGVLQSTFTFYISFPLLFPFYLLLYFLSSLIQFWSTFYTSW